MLIKPPNIKKEIDDEDDHDLTDFVKSLVGIRRNRPNEQKPIDISFSSSDKSSDDGGMKKRRVLKKNINKVPNKAQKNKQRKLSTLKSNVKKFVCDPSSKMSSKDFIYNNELLVNTFTFLITYMNCIIVGELKKSKHLVNYMWLSLLPASFNEYVPSQLNAPCLSSITAHKKQKEKIIRDYLEDESRKNEIICCIDSNSNALRFIISRVYLEIFYERDEGGHHIHYAIDNAIKI